MKMSSETNEVFCAFSLFQGEVEDVKRDTNSYKGKYAKLEQVIQVRKLLSKFGLGVTQMIGDCSKGYVELENLIVHKSGQYFSEIMKVPIGELPKGISMAQYVGLNISYARRYGLLALAGMAQEDNDAELPGQPINPYANANQHTGTTGHVAFGVNRKSPVIDISLNNQLKRLIEIYHIEDSTIELWKEKFNVNDLCELTDNHARAIINKILVKFNVEG